MPGQMKPEEAGYKPNAAQERIKKGGSIFAPGARIRMNIIPMFWMLFVPWGIFTLTCALSGFSAAYFHPTLVTIAIALLWCLWLVSFYAACWARLNIMEPTWLTYFSFTLLLAVVTGPLCGQWIYNSLYEPYLRVRDLKTITNFDVSHERSSSILDAGIVYFAAGQFLDGLRSWHFKHHTTYCVAPIVHDRSALPSTASYDFWAVGKDCCSTTSSDFRCGAWGKPHSSAAIRVLDEEDVPFYRLAVQQAETLYGITAANPVFFKWSIDPELEVNSWEEHAFLNFIFCMATSFVVSLAGLVLTTWKFAWLGRFGINLDVTPNSELPPQQMPIAPPGYRGPGFGPNYGGSN
jgi:hypothetical protein